MSALIQSRSQATGIRNRGWEGAVCGVGLFAGVSWKIMSNARQSADSLGERLLAAEFPHATGSRHLIETHISWVVLTGEFAYKIKKPVRFSFLDYSTPELRHACCLKELQINRRFAPEIYREVVPIRETGTGLAVGTGDGRVIDHAVRMRQFSQDELLDRQLASGAVGEADMDGLALQLAHYHATAPRVAIQAAEAGRRAVQPAIDNFDFLLAQVEGASALAAIGALRDWTVKEADRLNDWFALRAAAGAIRECHGDLHLANLLRIGGRFLAFDAIEFNDAFRQIDVIDEISFLAMELHEHGYRSHSSRLINQYLESTADYSALPGLRFYLIYRAMVRAKVDLIRQNQTTGQDRAGLSGPGWRYVEYAQRVASPPSPELWITHGFSGSGKSSVAMGLVTGRGLIRLRSDVLRKQMLGLDPWQPTPAERLEQAYSSETSRRVYDRMAELARTVLESGFGAIADATFLRRADRDRFAALAADAGVTFRIANCEAPREILESRLRSRLADPSDAKPELLQYQQESADPLTANELEFVYRQAPLDETDAARPVGPA
jgi:uncharacterized protein